ACGKTSIVPTPKDRFELPWPVVRVDAHGDALLFVSAAGDVAVWRGAGKPTALGRLGVEATLTDGAPGGPPRITSRNGTFALDAPSAPARAGAAPSHPGVAAFGRSGRFGLAASGRVVSFFVPGEAR